MRGISGIGPSTRQMALAGASPAATSLACCLQRQRRRQRQRFIRRLLLGVGGAACLTASALLTVFGGHLARLAEEAALHPRPPRPPPRSTSGASPTRGPEPNVLGFAERPFLVVYTSTCVMSLLLIGFACLPGWWQSRRGGENQAWRRRQRRRRRQERLFAGQVFSDEDADAVRGGYDNPGVAEAVPSPSVQKAEETKLSDPRFVPVQFDSSSTEADIYASLNADYPTSSNIDRAAQDEASPLLPAPTSQPPASVRRARGVRFSRVSEVRQLSESEAHAASMARMSYQAYQRAIETSLETTEELDEEDSDEDEDLDLDYDVDAEALAVAADAQGAEAVPEGGEEAAERAVTAATVSGRGALTVVETAKLALIFAPLWFLSAWCLLESQRQALPTPAASVFVAAAVAPAAALLLAAFFPSSAGSRRLGGSSGDAATLSKAACVLLGVGGALLVAWPQLSAFERRSFGAGGPWSAVLAALGALCVAVCLVGMRRRAPRLNSLPSLVMFCGFVGVVSCLTMWPGFFILHYSRMEQFQLPNATNWGRFVMQGFTGVALSEFLLLLGCYLTSSLAACMSYTMAVPLAYAAGVAFLHMPASEVWRIGLGGPLALAAFLASLVMPRVGDPLLRALIACRDLSAPAGILSAGGDFDDEGDADRQPERRRQHRRTVRRPVAVPAAASVAASAAAAPSRVN